MKKSRKKTFVRNDDYFKWYNENKENINIISMKITKEQEKIKIEYEEVIKE